MLESYLEFCEIRERSKSTGRIELEMDFVFPTTLLPLGVLIARTGQVLHASKPAVQGYVDFITAADSPVLGSTYLPLVRLPRDPRAYTSVIRRLEDLSRRTRLFSGNPNAYPYLLSELTDNIYEHASASRAYVMAQYYPKKGLIEASFMDDGVSIPKSLERGTGVRYPVDNQSEAILDALEGRSAKPGGQRGFGLRSSVRIVNALGGEALIVSGRGAVVSANAREVQSYNLAPQRELGGTLVSLRLPDTDRRVDFYSLVE